MALVGIQTGLSVSVVKLTSLYAALSEAVPTRTGCKSKTKSILNIFVISVSSETQTVSGSDREGLVHGSAAHPHRYPEGAQYGHVGIDGRAFPRWGRPSSGPRLRYSATSASEDSEHAATNGAGGATRPRRPMEPWQIARYSWYTSHHLQSRTVYVHCIEGSD